MPSLTNDERVTEFFDKIDKVLDKKGKNAKSRPPGTQERYHKLRKEFESKFGRMHQDFNDPEHPYPDMGRVMRQGMAAANAHFTSRARGAETASQRRSRERREENTRKRQNAMGHVKGKSRRFLNAKGALSARIFAPCKKALYPAKDGFPAGCASHAIHECPWFHPGEPEYEAVCSGKLKGPTKEGRNFNAAKREALTSVHKATKGKNRTQGRSGHRAGKNTRKTGRGGPPS